MSNCFSGSDTVQGAKYKAVYMTGNEIHLFRPKPQLQLKSQLFSQIILTDACFHRHGGATLLSQRKDTSLDNATDLTEEIFELSLEGLKDMRLATKKPLH